MPNTSLVDISALFEKSAEATETLDAEIAAVLGREGSFVATGAPGLQDIDASARELLALFRLPDEAKRSLAVRKHTPGNENLYRGYYPLPTQSHFSYNEIFDIGPEPPLPTPELPGASALREANVWPSQDVLAGWRQAALDYAENCRDTAVAVIAAAARGLGLAPDTLLRPCKGRNFTLRLLHYAKVPDDFELLEQPGDGEAPPADGRRVVARRHIDTGILSLLWQDEPGLQVKGHDGVWRDVPTGTGGLSIHCGDLLDAPSGGALPASAHRVLGGLGDRHSIGYFLEPDFERVIHPPADAEPLSYAAYLTGAFPGRFEPPAEASPN